MNTKQSPYDDIITRHLLDKFDKSIMAEMLAECLTPAGLETPMKMFIVRVAHVHFSLVEMELTSHDTFIMSEGSLL